MKLPRPLRIFVVLLAGGAGVGVGLRVVDALEKKAKREQAERERERFCDTWAADEAGCRLLEDLRAKYGPPVYSQNHEELIIRDFFGDKRDGFFVDVGAAHYKIDSTTFFFEEKRGWKGIAIDANGEFVDDYAAHRPNTKFFNYFVGDKSEPERSFFIVDRTVFRSSGNKEYVDQLKAKYHELKVPTITLDDLLKRENVQKVDLVSMDIELGEPAALAGFDIDHWKPALVCIEVQTEVAKPISEYFAKHHYEELTRYRSADKINKYYAPARL